MDVLEAPNPIKNIKTPNLKDNNSQEFYNLDGYYLKLVYNEKEELSIICYNTEQLDGICYDININIEEIYLLNDSFKKYKNIKYIYGFFINAIKEKNFKISLNELDDNITFSILLNDNKYINMPLNLSLHNNANKNNSKEYMNILSNEIKNLRNKYNKDMSELKKEISLIKELINQNKQKDKIDNNIIINPKINNNECIICGSGENLKKCICKKYYCIDCISKGKNIKCKNECYLFNNNLNTLTSFYQISKLPLPKNFEAKIHFIKVDMIRAGITFDPNIINETDCHLDSPNYNIYYKGQSSGTFYYYKKGWIEHFNIGKSLKNGDDLIIKVKDGKLNYYLNDVSMGNSFPLKKSDIDNKIMFLLIHRRTKDSDCRLEYIYELID